MCALAHYFEEKGIPTTVVALIREHAEAIKPPRAIWTTFELGRPLGAPEDAAFQRRVLDAALELLTRPSGPILEDYPEDQPAEAGSVEDDEGWVCPVSFSAPASDEPDTHAAALAREMQSLKPWHETWKRRRGATGVGVFEGGADAAAAFIADLADGAEPASPLEALSAADALKLAINDLMTFYQEAANAQPGQAGGSQAVSDWFWTGTEAGKAMLAARGKAMASEDKRLAFVADRLMLPHVAAKHA